ncbi:TonB protein C-terminal [Belliella buryatensis]|uniref:TonB protein C-terminal n=1 Tax=Belliella buryatensis TaxID=1500549 RepID=A0A239ALP4_9BACT|nr:energy transducer TonB [Belliella buryatensis]SNR95984.1 TonB protein C-terminal [Belliella buryatensis]
MKRILLTTALLFTYILTFGQELKFYNEFFFPVEHKKKSNPFFFSKTKETETKIEEIFYTLSDTTLIRKRVFEKGKDGNAISESITKFNSFGDITFEITRNLQTGFTVSKELNSEGNTIFQKVFTGNLIHDEVYFDENGNEIEKISEQLPEPHLGQIGWNTYIAQNIRVPKEVRYSKKVTRINMSFFINESGEIEDIEVLYPEEIHPALANVAYNLVKNYPEKWSPYVLNGEIKKREIIVPIVFNILGIVNRN